jgi:hypothetical protein
MFYYRGSMDERHTISGPWHRIERRGGDGRILDYVEFGGCRQCGRAVDRDAPAEYREVGGELWCAECASVAPADQAGLSVTEAVR